MKECEICGTINEEVTGKSGKHKMDLCTKHRHHMDRYGCITERTIYTPNDFIVIGDHLEITMYDKKCIKNGTAMVDIEFYDIVSKYKWHIGSHGYTVSNNNGETLLLHRLVSGDPQGMKIDHINHNVLDCRSSNLRICTHQENLRNTVVSINNTSGHKGVSWNKKSKKWTASITINRKKIHLGNFELICDAIKARLSAEIKYFGDFRNKIQEAI